MGCSFYKPKLCILCNIKIIDRYRNCKYCRKIICIRCFQHSKFCNKYCKNRSKHFPVSAVIKIIG